MKPEITICSVYHSDSTKRILELNEELVKRMNPGVSFVWLAVNNSPDESVHITSSGIREFPGAKVPPGTPTHGWTGYHDGSASNSLLPHIATRFVLFLDYDFFIVRPNWIREVTTYMRSHNVAILGAPYHPKYWVKFRYSPSKNCLFIDRERFGKEFYDWNFTPQYSPEHLIATDESIARKKVWRAHRSPTPPSWLRRMYENIKKRRYVGQSHDVCYDLYRRYRHSSTIITECFQAGAVPRDFLNHYYLGERWYPLLFMIERLIPERWSFVPKRKDYFTFRRFKDVGATDVASTGMEEWWWQGNPFGFHLRGFKERRLRARGDAFDPEENVTLIREISKQF